MISQNTLVFRFVSVKGYPTTNYTLRHHIEDACVILSIYSIASNYLQSLSQNLVYIRNKTIRHYQYFDAVYIVGNTGEEQLFSVISYI
jgi:hypothetical protein